MRYEAPIYANNSTPPSVKSRGGPLLKGSNVSRTWGESHLCRRMVRKSRLRAAGHGGARI